MKRNRIYFVLFFLLVLFLPSKAIDINDTLYEGRPHFIIKTIGAIYYFDKAGGGLSRMIDSDGNDWINFKKEPWGKVPESAASAFRGIPNAVFQGEDGGCGHPGFDQCISELEGENLIRTKSKSGKWEWTWEFKEDCAVLTVVKTDTTRNYWFLYEGTVGGSYSPRNSYWGNSEKGPHRELPDHMSGERVIGNWDWVYFGRTDRDNILFVKNCTNRGEDASFSYMGNSDKGIDANDGMLVFGFGRSAESKPLLFGNHQFVIGFIQKMVSSNDDHKYVSQQISQLTNNIN